MNILLSGATGFIGRNLVAALLKDNHLITAIGRDRKKILQLFGTSVRCCQWSDLPSLSADDFDVIINLCGENIAKLRWTTKNKQEIKNSRTLTTSKIVNWMMSAKSKKPRLFNASAIGIYGLEKNMSYPSLVFNEESPLNNKTQHCFLAEVASAWEAATKPAVEKNFPITLMRFGVVLKRNEGILKNLEPVYRLGLGSALGSGEQYFAWIHIDDVTNGIKFLINNPEITGPVNLVAPECVKQKNFAKILASVFNKKIWLKTPATILKLFFGQMAEELLLYGQKIYPSILTTKGFVFSYPTLASALSKEWDQNNINENNVPRNQKCTAVFYPVGELSTYLVEIINDSQRFYISSQGKPIQFANLDIAKKAAIAKEATGAFLALDKTYEEVDFLNDYPGKATDHPYDFLPVALSEKMKNK